MFKNLTPKQKALVHLVVSGWSPPDAYRNAFHNPSLKPSDASLRANRAMALPHVAAYMQELRAKSEKTILLTLNERLSICARIAQKGKTEAIRMKAIEVYSKLAGDHAPERHEITGANGGPIQSETAIQAQVLVHQVGIKDRLSRFAALRNGPG